MYRPLVLSLLFRMKYRKRRPSGKKKGQRWEFSPLALSRVVAGRGLPPDAGTCCRGPAFGENKIIPATLQLPPRNEVVSQMIPGGPPAMSTRLSLPCAKKATERLSGDQKGYRAPSVPASSLPERESNGRSQSLSVPCSVTIRAMSR